MGFWKQLLGGPADPPARDRYVDDWLKGIERGIVTATGLRVGVADALTVPGIAACIQVQSEDLAKVPLDLKRRTTGGYELATDHPLFDLLKYGPAPWIPSFKWRKALMHTAMAYGNHYTRVYRMGNGDIDFMAAIQPNHTTVRWAPDGEPFYDVTGPKGQERGLSWQQIIHVAYRDSHDHAVNGGILGVSPIFQNKETVALMLAAERFAGAFFSNGARPSIVLEYDKQLPNNEVAARMRAGIERIYTGLSNQWKVAILELGVKMHEMSSDPQKSQMTETRKHGAEQACTMFRTPPHKIGILDKATFSNIEQQSIDYVTGPLSTMARAVEEAIALTCLTPAERRLYKVEHNLDGLMRGDMLSRYRAYAIGRQWGWLSVNNVRVNDNLNEIGPDGDQYLVPLNMVPADRAGEQLDPQQDPQNPDQPGPSGDFWMPGDVRWLPAAYRAARPGVNGKRQSQLVGADGLPLYLH